MLEERKKSVLGDQRLPPQELNGNKTPSGDQDGRRDSSEECVAESVVEREEAIAERNVVAVGREHELQSTNCTKKETIGTHGHQQQVADRINQINGGREQKDWTHFAELLRAESDEIDEK